MQKDGDRPMRRLRERLCLGDASRDVVRMIEGDERDAERREQMLRHAAAFRLPRIPLTEVAAMTDQHQQRDAIQLGARDDPVDRGEEAVVLHQHRRFAAGEVRAGRDADPFLFLGEPHQDHPRIVLGHSNEVDQPRFWQGRDEPDPAPPEGVVDQPGVRDRDRHLL